MRPTIVATSFGLTLLGILAAADNSSEAPGSPPAVPPKASPVLRHSEVVFMYASTPEAYASYGATFVAWGGAESAEKVAMHRSRGIRCTGSVWCLTAGAQALHEDPKLRESVAFDIEGKPILVPWLFDHVHEGQITLFGDTNHPAFREHVKANVRRAMNGGADGLHVDDHLGVASPALWYGGGFGEASIRGFRDYLREHASPAALASAGVGDLAHFDYGNFVRVRASTREELVKKSGEIPLFDLWKRFHLEAAADFVEELRRVAEESAGHPVLLSANACLGNEAHHHVVPRLTHVVCEVWFEAQAGTRSLDGALRAFEAARRLGRPLACTASGHDWAHVKAQGAADLARFWIALTYTHGQNFMVPHPERQWCFDEAKGTHWYQAPVSEYAPLYAFIRGSAEILDGFEAAEGISIEAPEQVIARAREKDGTICVHLVLRDYDPVGKVLREAKDLRIRLQASALKDRGRARLFRPGSDPLPLPMSFLETKDAAELVIPSLALWGIIEFSRS
jgi:hypothetical protein